MPKFLIPTIYNNRRVKTESGFLKENGLGSGSALEFMLPQIIMAAQDAGYETYSVLYNTIKREEGGAIKADLVKIDLGNKDLIDRIMESEENFRGLTAAFNAALAEKKEIFLKKSEEIRNRIDELSSTESRNEEQEITLRKERDASTHLQEMLSEDKNWHYSLWHCQMSLVGLSQQILYYKNQEMISYLEALGLCNKILCLPKYSSIPTPQTSRKTIG
jgi:hypothetical protein